ncbi:hypothetical protein D9M69_563260 [compost metagenome]
MDDLDSLLPRLLQTAHKGRTNDGRWAFEATDIRAAAVRLGIDLPVSTKRLTVALKDIGAERIGSGVRSTRYAMKPVAFEKVTESV